jgi:hypothetical protein
LVHIAAVGGDTDHRSDGRRKRAAVEDLAAIQHVLQTITERDDVVRVVLQFERHTVVGSRRERHGTVGRRRRKGGDRNFALLEQTNHVVQPRQLRHAE